MGREALRVTEEKDFGTRVMERLTTAFLLFAAGAAAGYFWAVRAYGVFE
jgi:hypothetical protein